MLNWDAYAGLPKPKNMPDAPGYWVHDRLQSFRPEVDKVLATYGIRLTSEGIDPSSPYPGALEAPEPGRLASSAKFGKLKLTVHVTVSPEGDNNITVYAPDVRSPVFAYNSLQGVRANYLHEALMGTFYTQTEAREDKDRADEQAATKAKSDTFRKEFEEQHGFPYEEQLRKDDERRARESVERPRQIQQEQLADQKARDDAEHAAFMGATGVPRKVADKKLDELWQAYSTATSALRAAEYMHQTAPSPFIEKEHRESYAKWYEAKTAYQSWVALLQSIPDYGKTYYDNTKRSPVTRGDEPAPDSVTQDTVAYAQERLDKEFQDALHMTLAEAQATWQTAYDAWAKALEHLQYLKSLEKQHGTAVVDNAALDKQLGVVQEYEAELKRVAESLGLPDHRTSPMDLLPSYL